MYINVNSDRFSGMTLNLVQEGGIGIFWLTVWVTLRSERQLHASTDLELQLNANVIKKNA